MSIIICLVQQLAASIAYWHLSRIVPKDYCLCRTANERIGASFRKVMVRNKRVMYYVCCNFVTCKFVFCTYTLLKKQCRIAVRETLHLGSIASYSEPLGGLSHSHGTEEFGEVCFYFRSVRSNENVSTCCMHIYVYIMLEEFRDLEFDYIISYCPTGGSSRKLTLC